MEADTVKLTQLFRKDIRYVVPTFQRPYVWNKEEHWELLWDDIREVVEELIERRTAATAEENDDGDPEDETPPHFLGAIVLDQLANQVGKLETRRVIDGQQRLTTLQILFSAVRDVANELALDDQASLAEKLLFNDEDLIESGDHRLKVWPIERDQAAFRNVVMPDAEGHDSTNGGNKSHRIEACHSYLVQQLQTWATDGEESPQTRVGALVDTLWSLVRLVAIDLDQQDDPQVIFETLNARGTPLLAADLIKNFIFRQAEEEGESTAQLHDSYWKAFDEEIWRAEVSQGRLERPRIDVFVMHWLTMRTARQIRAQQLFPAFRNYLNRSRLGAREVLRDISAYADTYLTFSAPHPATREGLFFRRLDVLDTTTPYPVLLWIYGSNRYSGAERQRAVEAIESWLVRRMLCRLTTKNYNKVFLDLLAELKADDGSPLNMKVAGFLAEKEGSSDLWPTDEQLLEAMTNQRYWAQINQRRLRMFFRALERQLRSSGFSESVAVNEDLHIEHILPRDWAHHWELPGDEPEPVERMQRDEIKHRVGNLTILTKNLNPSISNASWEKKREAIEDHTVLLLNRDLLKRWYEKWNEETIRERAERLAELAADVWPGPKSNHWTQ